MEDTSRCARGRNVMKPLVVTGLCLLCLSVGPALSAEEPTLKVVRIRPNLDTEKLEYIVSTERRAVFERNMNLDERQSEIFWGVYHRYEKEKEQLEARRLRLLGTYIEKYDSLTNDEVMKIAKQSGENQQADLALRQKYFQIYSKKLNPLTAARFMQLDDIVGMVTRLAILGNVPLIGEVPHAAASEAPAGQLPQPALPDAAPAADQPHAETAK
jgi:hypothetical protein